MDGGVFIDFFFFRYVFEDVGIAAHLVCLWEIDAKEKGLKEKQSFVDLGCGNGFLVHILNSEGYRGRGIDLKKRRIWTKFGEETAKVVLFFNHASTLTPGIHLPGIN